MDVATPHAQSESEMAATVDLMGQLLQVPKDEADEVHRSHPHLTHQALLGRRWPHWWAWDQAWSLIGTPGIALVLWDRARRWIGSQDLVKFDHLAGTVTLRWPAPKKARLRRATLSVVADIRAYLGAQPDPTTALIRKVKDENPAGSRIWNYASSERDIEIHDRSNRELNDRFGGRVLYLCGEYERLDMLQQRVEPPGTCTQSIMWGATNLPFLDQTANQLEALARRL